MMRHKEIHLSPLQLDRYVFRALEIEPIGEKKAAKEHDEYPSLKDQDIGIGMRQGMHRSDPRRFGIQLFIELTPTEQKPFPYRFKIAIEGWFTVIQARDDLDAKNMATINGSGVLFGICREVLLSLTHRFSNGPVMLPTVDFRSLEEKSDFIPTDSRPDSASAELPLKREGRTTARAPAKRKRSAGRSKDAS